MRTIALLSFKEILYKKIFLITLLMTLAFLTLYGVANHYASADLMESVSASNPANALQIAFLSSQFLNMGLYFSSFITALLAVLATIGSVSSEVESHQIDTLLARPLRRGEVVLGKFIGLGLLLVAYATLMFVGVLVINKLFGNVLAVDVPFVNALTALMYFVLQPLVIISLALWLSVRTSTVNGGVVLIILYVAGFIGGMVEQIGAVIGNASLTNIGIISSLLFPTDPLFRKMTGTLVDGDDNILALATQGPFGNISEPSGLMIAYAVLYTLLALFFATRKFAKRDL